MKTYSVFDKIKRYKPILSILNSIRPGYGRCEKCGLTWNFCKSKSVSYSDGWGVFATCDYCWNHSTLEQLKVYYTILYHEQEKSASQYGGYTVAITLEYLLDCVEKEYYKDFSTSEKMKHIRKIKLNKLNKLNKILK